MKENRIAYSLDKAQVSFYLLKIFKNAPVFFGES